MKKRRLILVGLIVTFAVIQLLGSTLSLRIKSTFKSRAVDQYSKMELIIAEQVANILGHDIEDIFQKLNIISQSKEVRGNDAQSINKKLDEIFPVIGPSVSHLARTNSEGLVIGATRRELIGQNLTTIAPELKKIFTDKEYNPVLTRMRSFLVPGIEIDLIALHLPIINENGIFIGTLGAAIYLENIQSHLKDIEFVKRGYVVLSDDNGDVLFHPRKDLIGKNSWGEEIQGMFREGKEELNSLLKAMFSGEKGIKFYHFEGDEKVCAYTSANLLGERRFGVTVTVPVNDIYEETGINSLFTQLVAIMAVVVALVFLLFYLFTIKTIVKPIEGITGVIQDISRGKLDVKIESKALSSTDEIGDLARAFDRTLVSLKLAMREKDKDSV